METALGFFLNLFHSKSHDFIESNSYIYSKENVQKHQKFWIFRFCCLVNQIVFKIIVEQKISVKFSPVRSYPSRYSSTSLFQMKPLVFSVVLPNKENPDEHRADLGLEGRLCRLPTTTTDDRHTYIFCCQLVPRLITLRTFDPSWFRWRTLWELGTSAWKKK